ncbi:hypothetical protein [Carnobacterium jeotgali]|uniref:hypothetical protein n=1 Tax=Carnobacterium jeotgali TaxID=545534 RepID=UPI000552A8AF|nr:hypothetical protein [Carnobacterium jeotgali]
MDNFFTLFFDHQGNFQWSSIAACISFLVLLAQVAQFIYQQGRLKENKKLDIWIELRTASLKQVKESIRILLEHTTITLSAENLIIYRQNQHKLFINLNSNNEYYHQIIDKMNEYLEEYDKYIKGNAGNFNSKIILDLTKLYARYENKEIDIITNYKMNK